MRTGKEAAILKREKELESEMNRSKRAKPGHQILELNFKAKEEESLDTPTEKGTQTYSKLFVHTYTQSEEFDYPFNTPNIQPPFDRWKFQNDNVKVNFYTGLPSTAWKLKFDSILF